MDSNIMFELADRLRELREEKAAAELRLKELSAEIDEVDYRLSELMAETETQNFTRQGLMFCLTTKTRLSNGWAQGGAVLRPPGRGLWRSRLRNGQRK